MELPICPFFRKRCLLQKCAAFTTHNRYSSLYEVYDKEKLERVTRTQRRWIGRKFLGFGDKYEEKDVEEDITMCHIIRKVKVKHANCSVLNFYFGEVIWNEDNRDEWHEWKPNYLSIKQFNEKKRLRVNP